MYMLCRCAARVSVALALTASLLIMTVGMEERGLAVHVGGQYGLALRQVERLAEDPDAAPEMAQPESPREEPPELAAAPPPSPDASSVPATPPAAVAPPFDPRSFRLELTPVVRGLSQPVFITHAGDGSGRLFVVEKQGMIRVIVGGAVQAQPFLDLRKVVESTDQEQGLVALAFHPRFAENGRFFIAYTALNGDNTVAEYGVRPDGRGGPPTLRQTLLVMPHPYAPFHNTDMLAFGPDGYLYIGTGDGGGHGDPLGNGQNLRTLQGKLLRLDVDGNWPYSIPRENPFVGIPTLSGEVWAYGLRNPWRFSFDRLTGDLWVSDVGQNTRDEINFQPAHSPGGQNYGWNITEGIRCFQPAAGCDWRGLTAPVMDYGRDLGCAVIGGYVYRGARFPQMNGAYFYGDFCSSAISTLWRDGQGRWRSEALGAAPGRLSSFGEDERAELYITDLNGGAVYTLTALAPQR